MRNVHEKYQLPCVSNYDWSFTNRNKTIFKLKQHSKSTTEMPKHAVHKHKIRTVCPYGL